MTASFSRLWVLALLVAAISTVSTFPSAMAASQQEVGTMDWLASSSTGSGGCPADKMTLSSSCGGLCGDYEACLAYDAVSVDNSSCSTCVTDADELCTYQCFELNHEYPDGTVYYYFLVSYGSYVSDAETSERTTNPNFDDEVDALQNDSSFIAHASNDIVTTIGTLDVPVGTTSVYVFSSMCPVEPDALLTLVLCFVGCDGRYIGGGTTCMESVRGKMALVNFTSSLVAAELQVTFIMIGNINMVGQIDNVPSLVPSSTTYLQLLNVMLLDFPSTLGSISGLNYLYVLHAYAGGAVGVSNCGVAFVIIAAHEYSQLDYNYIKTVESAAGFDLVRYLYVHACQWNVGGRLRVC